MKEYETQINPTNCKRCKACGLYINQFPLVDKTSKADVFWVGLSAVQMDLDDKKRVPLSPSTRSGKLIQDIEKSFDSSLIFRKTNLVKCLPLNMNKIRYPELLEMKKCFPNLKDEIKQHNPRIVFLLGRQVAEFVFKQNSWKLGALGTEFTYNGQTKNGVTYIPIHHPSYMLVYKRKFIDNYQIGINNVISSSINKCISA